MSREPDRIQPYQTAALYVEFPGVSVSLCDVQPLFNGTVLKLKMMTTMTERKRQNETKAVPSSISDTHEQDSLSKKACVETYKLSGQMDAKVPPKKMLKAKPSEIRRREQQRVRWFGCIDDVLRSTCIINSIHKASHKPYDLGTRIRIRN